MTLTQRVLAAALLPFLEPLLRVAVNLVNIVWLKAFLRRAGAGRVLRLAIRSVIAGKVDLTTSTLANLVALQPTSGGLRYLHGYALAHLGQYRNGARELMAAIRYGYASGDAYFYLGLCLASAGDLRGAEGAYARCVGQQPGWAQALVNLAHIKLHLGHEAEGAELLRRAIAIDPAFSMAHQNFAALYDRYNYRPQPLDLEARPDVLLYDAYNVAGERAIHVGQGVRGIELFGKALQIQRRLAQGFRLPADLARVLEDLQLIDPALPIRLLPYEWTVQIGHIAMLDTYRKIQLLGWRPQANNLVLAPPGKVSNAAYLDCWRCHFAIVKDAALVDALFPYQRFIGDTFNGFLRQDGSGVSWPDMGAKAHIEWDRHGRAPLLELDKDLAARGRDALTALGMPRGAWFATLHVREGGYHLEHQASGQRHRNASIEDYLPAIRRVVEHGGWVVRVGDRSMKPLSPMPGVIDYPHSAAKSEWMDVFLCGAARFFIGTTSGLTNAVISFGTPCVLVNCLSNFSQLWNRRVLFALKPFWSEREARYLKLGEFTVPPTRWRIFDLKSLAEAGIAPTNNDAADILGVVEEMLGMLDSGTLESGREGRGATAFRAVMGDNTMWGNAHPSSWFFERHFDRFFGNPSKSTGRN